MTPSSTGAQRGVLAVMLAGAALLRLHRLGAQSLWLDEAWSWWVASSPWSRFWTALAQDVHPPLYYLLLKAWTAVAGCSEVALRLPSVAASVATLAVVAGLGRRLAGSRVGLIATALLSVSTLQLYYAQEARSYALLVLLFAAATWLLVTVLDTGSRVWQAAYLVVAMLVVYTHYMGAIFIAAHGLAVVLLGLRRTEARGPLSRDWLLLGVTVAVLSLPAALLAAGQLTGMEPESWVQPPTLGSLTRLALLLGGIASPPTGFLPAWGAAISTAGFVLVLLAVAQLHRSGKAFLSPEDRDPRWLGRQAGVVLGCWLTVPVVVPLGLSLAGLQLMTVRNLLPVTPALAIVLAVLVDRVRTPLARCMCIAAFVAPSLAALPWYFRSVHKEQWREAAAVVNKLSSDRDGFIYDAWFTAPALAHGLAAPVRTLEPLSREVSAYDRLWLVRSHSRDPLGVYPRLLVHRGFVLRRQQALLGVQLLLFERGSLLKRDALGSRGADHHRHVEQPGRDEPP